MAIDFPNSPSVNQTFTVGTRTWKYDGEKWALTTSLALDDLSDVVISSPTATQVISYNGSYWTNASASGGASITVSDTPPASPSSGALWYESDTGSLFVYYDSFWVDVSSSAAYDQIIGSIQAKGDLLIGSASQSLSRLAIGADGRRLVAYASATNGACWAPDTNNTVVDAKGDLLVGTSNDTVARLAVGTDGTVLTADSTAVGGVSWASQPAMFRNLIINGAMQVAQRGTSVASITTSGYRTADRWSLAVGTMGTWTNSVENDAPTGSGFRKSFKVLCTTADASPAAGDEVGVKTTLEGQNLQAIKKGTSSAEQLTLTFWVKANVTGTYVVWLYDADNSRECSKTYTINASATWEKKTIVIPADTTGAFDNDNNGSLIVQFYLGVGSNFTSGTLATTWASLVTGNRAVGQTNLAAATNNYWQITGVQLEVGPVATAFEFKPYDVELAQCQRYYFRSIAGGAAGRFAMGPAPSTIIANPRLEFPVTMRTAPTSIDTGGTIWLSDTTAGYAQSAIGIQGVTTTPNAVGLEVSATGLTQFRTYFLEAQGDANAYVGLSAEL